MALTLEQFGKALAASGLMTPEDVRASWNAIPAAERPKDADGFAQRLVAQKLLTEFQAKQMVAGRGASLVMGDYAVLAEIGAGGMGQVYKAKHRRMERIVALKVMSSAAMKDEAAVKRFQREVRAAARLEHPNIVTAYDSGEAGNVKYLVMQFVDGGDLSALVKQNGPLPIEKAVDYVLQAARGLAFAHAEGVIHRDIKPANLLLDKKGVVKILDMGLARIESSDDGLTATEQVMGTVDYMSPEQAANTKGADGRADIYSLGCTLWFLLTGKKAYDGDTMIARLMAHREAPLPSLVKTRDDAPWALEQALHKMLAKRPQDRFQSMEEVVTALEPFSGGGSSKAGMGSSIGMGKQADAELAAFFQNVGPKTIGPGTKTGLQKTEAEPKSATKAGVEATAAFQKPEADTDPKSQLRAGAPLVGRAAPVGGDEKKIAPTRKKQPPIKLIAGGVLGVALLVVAGIIVKVRDGDGNVVAELNAPDGVSAEVTPTVPAATTPAPIAPPDIAPSKLLESREFVWTLPENLGLPVNTERSQSQPTLTADELCLICMSQPEGKLSELVECVRPSIDAPFGPPKRLTGATGEKDPCLSADGLTLIYASTESSFGENDLWIRRRASRADDWGAPVHLLQEINGPDDERAPCLSLDGLALYFASNRPGGMGGTDIWVARRKSPIGSFEKAVNFDPRLNSPSLESEPTPLSDGNMLFLRNNDAYQLSFKAASGILSALPVEGIRGNDGWLSPDGRRWYFSGMSPTAGRDLWVMRRVPANSVPAPPPPSSSPSFMEVSGGTALRFNGENASVVVPKLFNDGSHPITIEAYFRGNPSRGYGEFGAGVLGWNGRFYVIETAQHLLKGLGATNALKLATVDTPSTGPKADRLRHVALVWDGAELRLYQDGVRLSAKPLAELRSVGKGETAETLFTIGASGSFDAKPPSLHVEGVLDEVRVSKCARYVGASFQPQARFEPDADTMALYHCDEGSGKVLHDASGNGRDGEILGAEWVPAEGPPATAVAGSSSAANFGGWTYGPSKPLFDGKSLAGWTGDTAFMTVENGVLVNDGKRGVVVASGEYRNFEVELDFRLAAGGNSGLGIFYPGNGDPSKEGLEVQMLDDPNYANVQPMQRCGSLYQLAAPTVGHYRSWPEWNNLVVRALGDEVEVVLNDTSVVKASRAELLSSHAEHAGLKRESGKIALFPHTARSEYGNIRVREATQGAQFAASPAAVIYLDDLPEKAWHGYQNLCKHGQGVGNGVLSRNGERIVHSLVTPPTRPDDLSFVEYDLGGRFEKFEALTYLTREPTGGPQTFRVLADGKKLWESPPQTLPNVEAEVSVSVKGVKLLRLEVAGLTSNSHPLWLEPRLTPSAAPAEASVNHVLKFGLGDIVEVSNIPWGRLDSCTLEALVRSDETAEPQSMIVDRFKAVTLARVEGRWQMSLKYEGDPAPTYLAQQTAGPLGVWQHAAAVVDKGTARLFVDGKLISSKALTKPLDSQFGDKLTIGKNLIGAIRAVRVSKIARYTAEFTPPAMLPPDADTLASYEYSDGSTDILKDGSGHNLDGKITGAKWSRDDGASAAPQAASAPSGPGVDLLPLVRVAAPTDSPPWTRDASGVLMKNGPFARTIVDFAPPEEYEVRADVVPISGKRSFIMGLSRKGKRIWIAVSGWEKALTKIEPSPTLGGGTTESTAFQLEANKPASLVFTVRKDRVSMTADGKTLIDWQGDSTTLPEWGYWRLPEPEKLAIGSWVGDMRVTRLELWPLSGGNTAAAPPKATAAASALFNGNDLADWKGDPKVWTWESGELVGKLSGNGYAFLSGTKPYQDFELTYEVRLQGDQANSGVQFRSEPLPPAPYGMTGPQCEIGGTGKTGYGGLWWEKGPANGVKSAVPPEKFGPLVKPDDYNRMTLRCVGKHVTITLNGTTTVDGDFEIAPEGLLGFQLVSRGAPVEVRVRKIEFRDLSAGGPAPSAGASSKLFFHDPGYEPWLKEVRALPVDRQLEAVRKKLTELNPGFDGVFLAADMSKNVVASDGTVRSIGINVHQVRDVSPVRALPNVAYLTFGCPGYRLGKLSDLSPLRGMALKNLNIHRTIVSDLAPLADCPTLTIVKVDDTNATQADIDALQKALPNCSISWDGTTDAAGAVRRTAEWILSNESNGWTLGILFDSKPIIVSEVAQLPVEPFTVNTVHMKTALDDDLARLRSCESITSLFLSGAPITDEGVLHLKKMKLMRILDLSRTAVSDASMPLVAGLANLDTLYLSEISIGDQGLLALQPLVKLKSLNVKKTRVTAEGVAAMQKAVPNCKIEWDGAPSPPNASGTK